ncbi:spore germination protein PF [Thermolongibacillus altinsuensis]|jgi:spore germination protein PF|uniref:Spore germination protein PF n=1 Tax=Thermolongibacillus altinsuensis TaxID=575256 RepID=A0A4R1QNH6_9BACL|nr:spore germination protein [Thermolongibacillus altinsuensis]TCL51079.1 spore germination protein PF [Thermolongibacillus altinsuensis]GMB08849.1 putative spore germination protein GerPF [Thermolongibacillus altinsuensis]
MPAIVGPIKITTVSSGAVVQVGDSLYISPKTTAKTYSGAGAFNTGDFLQTNNGISLTNTLDSDVFDSNVKQNN